MSETLTCTACGAHLPRAQVPASVDAAQGRACNPLQAGRIDYGIKRETYFFSSPLERM